MTKPKDPNRPRFDEGFHLFWNEYPKHVAKQDALNAWDKLRPSAEEVQMMVDALAWQRWKPEWLKNDGMYVPYPATWLYGKRWRDEPPRTPPLRRDMKPPITEEWHARARATQEAAFAKDQDEIRKAWAERYRRQGMSEEEIAIRLKGYNHAEK